MSVPQLILSLEEEDATAAPPQLVQGQYVCMKCDSRGPAVAFVSSAWCECAKCHFVAMFIYRGRTP